MSAAVRNSRYRDDSRRHPNWDYSSPASYFITICTKNRRRYFGEITESEDNEKIILETDIGTIARENWTQIPLHFPMVTLDKFVVMPDHFHGIIIFYGEIVGTRNLVSQNFYQKKHWSYNRFGPQSGNLGSVIRGYKASVKAYATKNNIKFSWQKGYDDRIIKSFDELEIKRNYINNNIKNWKG